MGKWLLQFAHVFTHLLGMFHNCVTNWTKYITGVQLSAWRTYGYSVANFCCGFRNTISGFSGELFCSKIRGWILFLCNLKKAPKSYVYVSIEDFLLHKNFFLRKKNALAWSAMWVSGFSIYRRNFQEREGKWKETIKWKMNNKMTGKIRRLEEKHY